MNTTKATEALKQMQAAGVPARRAIIVVATSVNESDSTFGIGRDNTLIYPTTCYPARQVLRAERGRSATSPLPTEWTSNQSLMSWLWQQGYVTGAMPSVYFTSKITDYDSDRSPNQHLARVFEFLLDQRMTKCLALFSIGPTQMYLKYSPICGGTMTSRFKTIEDLWKMYTARTVADVMGYWFDYLPTNAVSFPTANARSCGAAGDNTCVETYLQTYQTGQVDWSDSVWASYAQKYAANVRETWNLARSLGYS